MVRKVERRSPHGCLQPSPVAPRGRGSGDRVRHRHRPAPSHRLRDPRVRADLQPDRGPERRSSRGCPHRRRSGNEERHRGRRALVRGSVSEPDLEHHRHRAVGERRAGSVRTGSALPGLFLESSRRDSGRRGESDVRLPREGERRPTAPAQRNDLHRGGLPMRMMLRARTHDERGATIVIVGLMLVAIMGMLALVTDVGGLIAMKRRVVTATDSAALASAQSFARNQGGLCGSAGGNATALASANNFAQDNVSNASSVSFTPDCHDKSVEVSYKAPVHFFFAKVIGAGSGDEVPATSTAIWGPVGRARPAPIMVFESQLQACGIPDTVPPDGETVPCDLTFNAHAGDGAPYWGEMDFNHWNDATPQKCSVSAAQLKAVVNAGG